MRIAPPSPGRGLLRAAAALAMSIVAAGSPAFAAPDDLGEAPAALLSDTLGVDVPAPAAKAPNAALGLLRQLHERTTEMAVATMDLVGVRYRRGGASVETGFD